MGLRRRSDAMKRALIGDPFGTQTCSSSSCLLLIKPTAAAAPRYQFTLSVHRKALKDYCTTANLTQKCLKKKKKEEKETGIIKSNHMMIFGCLLWFICRSFGDFCYKSLNGSTELCV